ncbi:MAG: TPM domain-containing protein [Gammaproteobacteria bacterium]|jgi:putative membrane protein
MRQLSQHDRERIRAAVEAAEKRTSGEFVTVLARRSDDYYYIPMLWSALAALIIPGLIHWLGWLTETADFYLFQLALFVVLAAVFLAPGVRIRLVPRRLRAARAARMAYQQFVERGVHATRDHSGVLLFVSRAEHYVEILADAGIHQKVGEKRWEAIVADFVSEVRAGRTADGFVTAIEAIGEAMAEHYPRGVTDSNELPDGLVEI